LKADDNLFTVGLDRALELLAIPKTGRGKRSGTKSALRELGNHPEEGEPINIYDGPYGPYIKYGKTNVSIPEDKTIENISLEEALQLITEKAGTKKGGKATKAKTTKTKTTKTATTKATTTKAATTKAASTTTAKAAKTTKTTTKKKAGASST
jgi:DNA topoisomerase I